MDNTNSKEVSAVPNTTVESVKDRLNALVGVIAREVAARAALVSKMNAEIDEIIARYQPAIDLHDKVIKESVDTASNIAAANYAALFPKLRTLKLPNGSISVREDSPSYKVIDLPGMLDLLRRRGLLNKVAPAKRVVSLTELKKLKNVLRAAIAKNFVSAEGGGDTLTIKPNDADATGAPSLARPITT